MIVGHFPHLPRLLALLVTNDADRAADFPQHGIVALEQGADETWAEMWRVT